MNKLWIAQSVIRMLAASWRIRIRPRGAQELAPQSAKRSAPQSATRSAPELPKAPAVVVFWHDEMLAIWKVFAGRKALALTSRSQDGELLAGLLQAWTYKVVRGSASSGGREALAEMARGARHNLVLVTPDGSRGPRHELKPGAVVAAARAQAPIYCARIRCKGHRLERSWDKFLIPWPFTAIDVHFSAPILPPAAQDRAAVDRTIRTVEQTLRELS